MSGHYNVAYYKGLWAGFVIYLSMMFPGDKLAWNNRTKGAWKYVSNMRQGTDVCDIDQLQIIK